MVTFRGIGCIGCFPLQEIENTNQTGFSCKKKLLTYVAEKSKGRWLQARVHPATPLCYSRPNFFPSTDYASAMIGLKPRVAPLMVPRWLAAALGDQSLRKSLCLHFLWKVLLSSRAYHRSHENVVH